MGDVPSRPGLTGLPFPGLESFPGMERNCVLSQNKKSGKIFNTQEIFIKAKREKCEGWDSNPRTPTRLGPQPSAFDLAWLPSPLCHNKEVVYLIKTCVSARLSARGRDRNAAGSYCHPRVEPGDPAWSDYQGSFHEGKNAG